MPFFHSLARTAYHVLLALFWFIGATALVVMAGWPPWIAWFLLVGVFLAIIRFKPSWWVELAGFDLCLAAVIWYAVRSPSNNREWWPELSVLPETNRSGKHLTITGFREFDWHPDGGFDARWTRRTFDLEKLDRLEFVVVPFGDSERMAHTMMIFGFSDGNRVVVSVEVRKEIGEEYGILPGMLKQFELIYLFGSEHDVLGVRAVARGERIYAYPVRAEPDFIRALFTDLTESANSLHLRPRFYRSIRDNCTTTLVREIERVTGGKIGLQPEILFNARAGELLHRRGNMDTRLNYRQAREHFRIDHLIRDHIDDPDFPAKIRPMERGTPVPPK